MVTKRYAHILDEDRRRHADEMEQSRTALKDFGVCPAC